jgi:hypothetical protein
MRRLQKAATGIAALDERTGGGLRRGRPTLVCGGAGCRKIRLAMEFLVRGAVTMPANRQSIFVPCWHVRPMESAGGVCGIPRTGIEDGEEVMPASAPIVPGPPASFETAAPRELEFSGEQGETIGSLGTSMRAVGLFFVVLGLWVVVAAAFTANLGVMEALRRPSSWIILLQGVLAVIIGVWTRAAGSEFQRVATTAGADIQHLMDAVVQLRKVYRLQWLLILAAMVLLALFVVATLFTPILARG